MSTSFGRSFSKAAATLGGAFAAALAFAALTACASKSTSHRDEVADLNAQVAEPSAQLQRSRIRDWAAPNDHTIVMVSNDGTRFRAETLGPCPGLDFATRVAFVNRGGFQQIDRFSSVVLGDGTRCAFQTFDRLKAPESKALDSYEKSGEARPQKDEPAKDGETQNGETKDGDAKPK